MTPRRHQAARHAQPPTAATLLAVMSAMSDGLVVLDESRRPLYANPRANELLGIDLAALLGLPEVDALRRLGPLLVDPRSAWRAWRRALGGPAGSATFETLVLGPPPRALLVETFRVANSDGRRRTGVLLRDVSHERDLAREKNDLLGAVSHELRTPLAAVVGFAELMLKREYAEPQRREFLTMMLREGWRLTRLINNLLDLQGLENGAEQMVLTPTPLPPLIARAVKAVGEDAASPIVIEAPDNLPLVVADADRIEDVLVNLLSNARKYSPDGGAIRVALHREGGQVHVAVSDHGQGIPADALPRLFEKFYRTDNSDGRTTLGAGLGLALVRSTVEAHGGKVRADSAGPRQGSAFTFTLPIAHTPATRRPPADAEGTRSRAPAGADILIVENEPGYARWLSEALIGVGHTVRLVATGEAALQAIAAARPAAVLLNVTLTGQLDGWDLLAVLRGRPDTCDLPVVVVSGPEDYARGRALGVDDYMVKLVSEDILLSTLRRVGVVGGRAVLVVDDDEAMRDLLIAELQEAGFVATGVGTGQQALAGLDAGAQAYGLLLLDLVLPDTDGFAVLEAIRARPALSALPVLVLTGRDLTAAEDSRLAAGAAQVLSKAAGIGETVIQAVARAIRPPAVAAGP